MNGDKLISFILTVYNKEHLLDKCLKSLKKLSKYKSVKNKFEVIAINDCSSDRSLKKLKSWKKKIINLRIINNKKNMGVSQSRNLGIIESKAKFLYFIDADDYIISKNFKQFIEDEENFKNDLIIFYNMVMTNKSLFIPKIKKTNKFISIYKSIELTSNNTKWNVWKFVFNKKFLLQKKIFFKTDLYQNEDWVFIAENVSNNPNYKLVQKHLYCYNHNLEQSLTVKILKKNFLNSIKTYIYLKKIKVNHLSKKLINLMFKKIEEILLIDAFLLKQSEIYFFKKKYFFLKKILKKNEIYRFKIIKNRRKILVFCAGRFGRALTNYLPKSQIGKKIIIDQNIGLFNKKYNDFIIKDFKYFSKNKANFHKYDYAICNFNKQISALIKKKISSGNIDNNRIITFI